MVVSHEKEYGLVESVDFILPSTKNSTFVTATLSDALDETVSVPETVVPPVGVIIETVGAVISEIEVGVGVGVGVGVATITDPLFIKTETVEAVGLETVTLDRVMGKVPEVALEAICSLTKASCPESIAF